MPDLKISELDVTTNPDGLFVAGQRTGSNFQFDVGAIQESIDDHIAGASGAHAGTAISNAPAGGISATTVQAAINELDTDKAPLASPVFTGNPTAPTPSPGDNDTSIATTAFVNSNEFVSVVVSLKRDAFSPTDATTYYSGPIATLPTTIEGSKQFGLPTGTIVACQIMVVTSNTPTASNTVFSLRENATTDYQLSPDFVYANGSVVQWKTGLSIDVSSANKYEIKQVTPTWVTNPTGAIGPYVVLIIRLS